MNHDPFKNFNYRLEIDGVQQAGFSACSGLTTTTDPIEYRDGHAATHVRKLPGLTRHGNITLERGLTGTTALHTWHQHIVDGDMQRRDVALVVVDEGGNDKVRYAITAAWPCKFTPADLNPAGNTVAIETLELCHEGVKLV